MACVVISTMRSSTTISSSNLGCWRASGASAGNRIFCAVSEAAEIRNRPAISPTPPATISSAVSAAASISTHFSWYSCPASVSDRLRVVRFSRRTPNSSSSWLTAELSTEVAKSNARDAAEKEPWRTTIANSAIRLNRSSCIVLFCLSER